MIFSDTDREMMALALQLAERGRYTTSPNPRVGCVITQNDKLVAEGWHVRAGSGHAEVNALAQIDNATDATVYVTLEPCSHSGRTPPCADKLIDANVARVVVAIVDPNPVVAGQGIARLRDAGIQVDVGLMAEQAADLNKGFMRRISGGLPWVRLKSASSLDGRTAMASGESQWITGPAARQDVQRLRAESCAIVSGVDTILYDNALFTVRPEAFAPELKDQYWRQPLRVILDSNLRTPVDAKLFSEGGEVIIATVVSDPERYVALTAVGAIILCLADDGNGRVSLPALMRYLADRGCNDVLVEAGATLAGSVLRADLVDEWFVYMAPSLMGSTGRPLVEWPMSKMAGQQSLEIIDIRAVGKDWRIHCCIPALIGGA